MTSVRGRGADASHTIEVFYDGACPLCVRETRFLRRRDRDGVIRFTDIASSDFDPRSTGIGATDLMDRIHGRLPDGTIIEGVEVFRRLYTAIGWGWLVGPTRLPVVRHLLDWAYRTFARNRLRWTGRCDEDGCRTAENAETVASR